MFELALDDVETFILTIILIGLILFIQLVVLSLLKKIIMKSDQLVIDDVATSITILVRMISGIIIIFLLITIYNLPSEIILLISALIGAIISLSSLQVLNNILSGILISVLNPYRINDYIGIGQFEGKVITVSLNTTKLLTIDNTYVIIQNKNIFRNELMNYSIINKKKTEKNKRIFDLLDKNSFIKLKKYIQYSFQLSVPLSNYITTRTKLEDVCDQFKVNFKYKPYFFPITAGFKLEIQFIVITPNSDLLLKYLKNFRESLVKEVY